MERLAGVSRPGEPAPAPAPVAPRPGVTFGVEEEFHLVDPVTYALTPSPGLIFAALRGEVGERIHPEISMSQLETATGICTTLAEVRAELVATRAQASAAATGAGVALLVASTHPFANWRQQALTPAPRYEAMVERWAHLVLQNDICGCHVHVGVPDLDTAVAVMDRVRPYLPLLLAMTGSSPFHDGVDTGYDSYRTLWWSRWPMAGPPEHLGNAAGFRAVVEGLVASGLVADTSHLYWDVRPSYHLPTLEFRLADVCTDVDDAVLLATLSRALVTTTAREHHGGTAPPEEPWRADLHRAAHWRAARDGVAGELVHPRTGRLASAGEVAGALVDRVAGALEESGDRDLVEALLPRLLEHGGGAGRQRAVAEDSDDLTPVLADLAGRTHAG